jgi:meiotic recombination protein SPO11
MQVYTNGSRSAKHSRDHTGLALGKKLSWMGVKASEWLEMGVGYDQLLDLSDKDVEKVRSCSCSAKSLK